MATTSTPHAEQAVHRSGLARIVGLALIAAGVVLLPGCTSGSSTSTGSSRQHRRGPWPSSAALTWPAATMSL